jgi:alpha-galactosidase
MNKRMQLFSILIFLVNGLFAQQTSTQWLDELDIAKFSEGIPSVNAKANGAGEPMTLGKLNYQHGLGIHSTGVLYFLMDGKALSFSAMVGVDDKANKLMVARFYVIGDQKILFESGDMKVGDEPKKVNVDLKGIKKLGLLVTNNEEVSRNYADWADAQFTMIEQNKPGNIPNSVDRYILTPASPKTPHINSPKIFGARPGNPFLFTVVASGEGPFRFSVENLPEGLTIDPQTGIIIGKVMERGTYHAVMVASNKYGTHKKELRIRIGDTISLTPPIGWNGWNSWAREIDKEKVVASANAMVKMGLSNHGWTYINIDDAWQGQRDPKTHALQANEKFPAFKQMIDDIHAKGLKLGVYSTPWIASYAGYAGASSNFPNGEYPDSIKNNKRAFRYIGKYRFELEDAKQMAEWGVDYLKYDWRIELNSAERMSKALKESGRDIVYSLSNSAPFALVKDWARISEAWRTGPDIRDSWISLYVSAFTLDKWAPYTGLGHWNDPDMMILGNVTTGAKLHPTRLTPDEQYSHVSMFSLLSAPLLIGCPIEQLDAFTLNLLTNDEVIDIDQDPLGKSARLVSEDNGVQVWLKPLEDGSYAIGMFNTADYQKTPQSYFRWGNEPNKHFTLDLEKYGLKGKWSVRDVWRQKTMGEFSGSFTTDIRHHGVVMIRLSKIK